MKHLPKSPYLLRPLRRRAALLPLWAALAGAAPGCDDVALPVACSSPDACPPPSNSIGWAVQIWPASTSGTSTGSDSQLPPQELPQLLFDRSGTAELHPTPARPGHDGVDLRRLRDALGQQLLILGLALGGGLVRRAWAGQSQVKACAGAAAVRHAPAFRL